MSKTDLSPLFQEFTLNNLLLKNCFVMAPMTRSMSPNNIPGPNVAEYYRKRAEGCVGLIITEGTAIPHKASHGYPDVPNFYGEALVGWKDVVNAVHDSGGKIFPQLWHVGSVRQPGMDPDESIPGYGPSAVRHPFAKEPPVEMSQSDIDDVIQSYADAAADAKYLGFDGVEIHGAHGYLVDQFFWDQTNKRSDSYGGKTLKERTRFACEVIQAVRKAVGDEFPVCFRFSQWKLGDYDAKLASNPEELEDFLIPLANAGVDIFHCSTRYFERPEFEGSPLNLAGWTKKITGKPVITVGSIGLTGEFIQDIRGESVHSTSNPSNLYEVAERMQKGEFDLIAVGRPLISDSQWVKKVRDHQYDAITPFTKEALKSLA